MKKYLLIIITGLLIMAIQNKVFAVDYYWVGGSGNWSDFSTHWATSSGGSTFHVQVPQSTDNVYFDANSFSAPGQTVTINQTIITCRDMIWTNATNNPTLICPSTNTLKVYGSLRLIAAMTFSFSGPVTFEAVTTGHTITSAGKSFSNNISFNGIGGSWTLQDAFTTTENLYLNNGTLTTNNQTVNAKIFYSNSGSTRTLNMGSSTFNVSWFAGPGFWNVTATGMTLNAGTSVIRSTANQSGWSASFNGGGLTYYDLIFVGATGGGGDINGSNIFHDVSFAADGVINGNNTFNSVIFSAKGTITGNNTYSNLTFTPGYTYTLTNGRSQTISGTFTGSGNCSAMTEIKSSTAGSSSNISKSSGNVSLNYVTLKDISSSGGAVFTANNSIDLGNNAGWTINSLTPQNLYWVGNSGNWGDGSHWAFTSGGTPSGCSPMPVDNVFFDANSFSSTGQTVTINVPTANCNNMSWTGALYNPTFSCPTSSTLNIFGSLTLINAMNLSFSGPVNFEATSTGKTISSAGKSFGSNATFKGVGGGWTLQDAFSTTENLYLNNGTLTTANYNVSAKIFYSNSGTARTLNMGSSTFFISWFAGPGFWNVTAGGMTLNCGTSTIISTANQSGWSASFNGGGLTYYDLVFQGATGGGGDVNGSNTFHNVSFAADGVLNGNNIINNALFSAKGTITGNNTYNNLTFTSGYTYTLTSGRTQTINNTFDANGNCASMMEIKSNTSGSQSSFSHPPGSVSVSYITLKDINATGGAAFTANNSIDMGNNTGWTINGPSPHDLYWIGNGGNWSDGNHWSLSSGGAPWGCPPMPTDNVFFDVNSFSAGGQTVNINIPTATCRNITWTGVSHNPVFSCPGTGTLKIYGSMTLAPAMTLSFSGLLNFEAISSGHTITSAGKSFSNNISFNGIGGAWSLQDAFTTTENLNLNNGTLTTNSHTVNAKIFYSNSGSTRTLNMGSSTFNVSWFAGPGFWNVTATGMTLNAGTSIIRSTANQSGWSASFNGGGLTYYDLIFVGTTGGGGDINGSNTFNNVNFAADGVINGNNTFNDVKFLANGNITGNNTFENLILTPGKTYTLTAGRTQTITPSGQIYAIGTGGYPIRIQSSVAGSQSNFYKTSGTICLDFVRLSDNKAYGGAIFDAGPAPTHSQDMGGNSGWTFSNLPAVIPPQTIQGPSFICAGQSSVQYYINPPAGTVSFAWTIPTGATISSGINDTMITLNFPGIYDDTIVVTAYGGCTGIQTNTLHIQSGTAPVIISHPADYTNCFSTASFDISTINSSGMTYQWFENDGSGWQQINNGGTYSGVTNDTLIINNTAGMYGYLYHCVVTGCGSSITSNTASLLAGNLNEWLGYTTDWNTASNWVCGIPTPTIDVVIPDVPAGGNFPLINTSGISVCRDILIEPLANVGINSLCDLSVYGNWTNNGQKTTGNGAVIFAGTTQSINGVTTFGNLTINNGSNTTILSTGQEVSGIILCNGQLFANDNLTLLSTASATALVDGSGTGNINGVIRLQRFISIAKAVGYKHFSTAFSNSDVGQFSNFMTLHLGNILNTPFPTLFKYNEADATILFGNGWAEAAPQGQTATIMNVAEGYTANLGSGSSSDIISFLKGNVNNGNISVNLTRINPGAGRGDGWNLVGNPYPSPIDLDVLPFTNANINKSVSIFISTSQYNGYYGYYNAQIHMPLNGGTRFLGSLHSFFVQCNNISGGTLTFTNSMRSNTLNPLLYKQDMEYQFPLIRLSAGQNNSSTGIISDETAIMFFENATENIDSDYDASKLWNTDPAIPNFYSIAGNNKLAMNGLNNDFRKPFIIPLGLYTQESGEFVINSEDIINFPEGIKVVLEDRYLQRSQNLIEKPVYLFDIQTGENAEGRFFLKIGHEEDIANNITSQSEVLIFTVNGNLTVDILRQKGSGSLEIYDISGRLIFITTIHNDGRFEYKEKLADGIYTVKYVNNEGATVKKIFVTQNI